MMHTEYKLHQKYPHSEFLQVEVLFKELQPAEYIDVHLPAWRPGRYQLGNFSKNIRSVKAFDSNGNQLNFIKINRDSWRVYTSFTSYFKLQYECFTYVIDGGSTFVNEDIWYLNFINCMMYTNEGLSNRCTVDLDIPDNWQIATSLKVEGSSLTAKSFYELVDSPLIASKNLQHLTYSVQNVNFHLWFYGEVDLSNKKEIISDFEKFTQEQLEMMEEFETSDYHFLFQLLPYKAYHGVEHFSSTSIILGPASDFQKEELYDDFLGISSHELFHYWNIIRIRPSEMFPYNFQTENYFTTGYVAEGVTTYYGDLFLVRSKVRDLKWYLTELNKLLKRHFENYGRFNHSVADSSYDLWVDGYEAGTPHRKVSIYVKGAIIAMILDLRIIIETEASHSLDDVMKTLWHNNYKKGKGYTSEDYLQAAEKVIGGDLSEYAKAFIYGTEPVEDLLTKLLPEFGFELQLKPNEQQLTHLYGIKLSPIDDKQRIISIAPNSIAEQYFRLGDDIISINDHPVKDSIIEVKEGRNAKIVLWRANTLHELEIEGHQQESAHFSTYEVKEITELSDNMRRNRLKWLKH